MGRSVNKIKGTFCGSATYGPTEFQCEFAPGPVKVSIAFAGTGSWPITALGPSHRPRVIPPVATPKVLKRSRRDKDRSDTLIPKPPMYKLLAAALKVSISFWVRPRRAL